MILPRLPSALSQGKLEMDLGSPAGWDLGFNSPIPPELAALGKSPFPVPKNSHLWHQIPHFALSPILPSPSFPIKEVSVPPSFHILGDRSRNPWKHLCSDPKSPRNSWDSRKIQTNKQAERIKEFGYNELHTNPTGCSSQNIPVCHIHPMPSIPREWG